MIFDCEFASSFRNSMRKKKFHKYMKPHKEIAAEINDSRAKFDFHFSIKKNCILFTGRLKKKTHIQKLHIYWQLNNFKTVSSETNKTETYD